MTNHVRTVLSNPPENIENERVSLLYQSFNIPEYRLFTRGSYANVFTEPIKRQASSPINTNIFQSDRTKYLRDP